MAVKRPEHVSLAGLASIAAAALAHGDAAILALPAEMAASSPCTRFSKGVFGTEEYAELGHQHVVSAAATAASTLV